MVPHLTTALNGPLLALEAADTELGGRRVETILNNIWHGLPV